MWIIDKDHIADLNAKPGTNLNAVGKRSYGCDESKCIHKFKMYDDDGELYYSGRGSDCDNDPEAFEPLDDFGMPNAGCTEIRYLTNGKYQTL